MKNIIVTILVSIVVCTSCLAGPRHIRPPAHRPPVHRVCPAPRHHVVPVVVGAAVGAAVAAICPPPTRVWVPGTYVTVMDAFGRPFTRYVPGHWEYR